MLAPENYYFLHKELVCLQPVKLLHHAPLIKETINIPLANDKIITVF